MRSRGRPTAKPSRQAGFTLLELLVGLALFAIVLSLVPGALQLGKRAWEDATNSDRSAQVAGVRSFLEQRLAEAMPVSERDASGRRQLAFAGRRQSLMFVSPAPDGSGGAGIYRFEIVAGQSASGHSASVVIRQRLFSGADSRGGEDESELLANVAVYGFRYFGSLRNSDAPAWHHEWPRTDVLPDLIELSVVLGGRNAPAFRPLVIETRLRSTGS